MQRKLFDRGSKLDRPVHRTIMVSPRPSRRKRSRPESQRFTCCFSATTATKGLARQGGIGPEGVPRSGFARQVRKSRWAAHRGRDQFTILCDLGVGRIPVDAK